MEHDGTRAQPGGLLVAAAPRDNPPRPVCDGIAGGVHFDRRLPLQTFKATHRGPVQGRTRRAVLHGALHVALGNTLSRFCAPAPERVARRRPLGRHCAGVQKHGREQRCSQGLLPHWTHLPLLYYCAPTLRRRRHTAAELGLGRSRGAVPTCSRCRCQAASRPTPQANLAGVAGQW